MTKNNVQAGNLNLCCNQPPRLLQGPGFGYALICTECGNGLGRGFQGDTFQSARFLWNRDFDISIKPKPASVPLFLLKELNDAHDVLRSLAGALGVGGYNASQVDAKIFGAKVSDGIVMLTKPLLDQIDTLRKEKDRLQTRVAEEILSGFEKDEKIAQNKEAVVVELTFEGCSYALKKNGLVDIVILKSGRGFTRHVNNISLSVQQALEKQLSEKRV